MARQGNYVTVPGGGVDWTSGISSSLMDLAKSYLAQGEAEKDRERLAARDAIAEKQANLAMQLSQARLDEINKAAAGREAGLAYIKDYTPAKARQALFDSNPEMQKYFADQMATDKQTLARRLMTDYTRQQQRIDNPRAIKQEQQDIQSNLPQQIDMGSEFGELNKGLTEESAGMVDANGNPIDYSVQFDELLTKGESSPMLEEYKKGVEQLQAAQTDYIQQNMPLYKGQQTAFLTKELMSRNFIGPESQAAIAGLTSGHSIISDLTDRAIKFQKAEQDRNDKLADLAYKSFTLASKGSKGDYVYIKPKEVTDVEVEKVIKELDTGPKDSMDLLSNYKAAVDAGVPTYIALEALKRSVEVKSRWFGLFTTRTTDYSIDNPDASKNFVKFAEGIAAGNASIGRAKAGGVGLSQEELLKAITPEVASYKDPEEQNRLAFLGGRKLLGPKPSPNDFFPKRIEGGVENLPKSPSTAAVDPSILLPQVPGALPDSTTFTPKSASFSVDISIPKGKNPVESPQLLALKKELGGALDIDWPEVKVGGKGNRTKIEPQSKREKLSRKVLEAYNEVASAQRRLDSLRAQVEEQQAAEVKRYGALPGDVDPRTNINTNAIKLREKNVEKATENYEKLKGLLLGPDVSNNK